MPTATTEQEQEEEEQQQQIHKYLLHQTNTKHIEHPFNYTIFSKYLVNIIFEIYSIYMYMYSSMIVLGAKTNVK